MKERHVKAVVLLSIGMVALVLMWVTLSAQKQQANEFAFATAEPCTGAHPPEEVAAVGVTGPYSITKSALVSFYTNTVSVTVPGPTYPLTITCDLRRGGVPTVTLARQVFTWTVNCAEEYTTEPVVPPLFLTWWLDEPLEPGWYEEFCRSEVDGIYGWIPGQGQDGDNFFMLGNWEVEETKYRCYAPLIMRRWYE